MILLVRVFIKEFSVCRLIHLNTIANFKNFRGKIRKSKKNNK